MNLPMLTLVVSFSFFFAVPQSGKPIATDAEIRAAVAALNSQSAKNSFDLFYTNPQEATKRGHYLTGEHPRAVWIVRALRSLTGLDFRARTKAPPTADETHFLGLNAKGKVEFFGTWMSRDSAWVAPKDAQIQIIKQWKEWFAQRGRGCRYVNDRNFDDWYF